MEQLAIFSEHCAQTELPCVITDLQFKVIEYNDQCLQYTGIKNGMQLSALALNRADNNEFPYTAVLTIENEEFLSCVCQSSPSSKHITIYFAPMGYSIDTLLYARYIIEKKRLESKGDSYENASALHGLNSLMVISRTFSDMTRSSLSIDEVYKMAEYSVFRFKQAMPEKMNVDFDFSCSQRANNMGISMATAVICMITVFLSCASDTLSFRIDRTINDYVFEITIKNVYEIENIKSCGFAGLFLSKAIELNDWTYVQKYDAQSNAVNIRISSPIVKNKFKLSAQSYEFVFEDFLDLSISAMIL